MANGSVINILYTNGIEENQRELNLRNFILSLDEINLSKERKLMSEANELQGTLRR